MALRIKSNVDLKELEKYGFNCLSEEKNFYDKTIAKYEEIIIYDREIDISLDGWETKELDTLYDLIQDGLIEKVSD